MGRFSQCFRAFSTKRKYPIDPEHVNSIPVFQYAIPNKHNHRVYVWGNARTGALGIPYLKKKENLERVEYLRFPKRLHFAEKINITTAACGFGFTLFGVDSNEKKLYGTGINTDSEIGYHEMRADKPLGLIFFPQSIHLPLRDASSKVKKVAAGRAHSAVLTDEGLFLFGNNAYGQCGRKIVENEDYVKNQFINHVSDIEGNKIIDIECGQDHTLAITENGAVYSCGWGADGQTGLGHFNCESKFTKVLGDIGNERIIKLACRSDFVLALNEKYEVFGWGNTEYSQISMPDNSQQVCHPTYIKMLSNLGKITDVAAGGSSCLVLNENGQVYVWGFGLLGTGPEVQESKVPIPIPRQLFGFNDFNLNCKVESIVCGLSHMAAVTNMGDLYSWGRNRSSCLGLGDSKDQYFPLKVAIGAHVEKVFCGVDHTIALCKSYMNNQETS